MNHPTTAYIDWKAPAEDGQLLIWPEPDQLLSQTRQNHALLSGADDVFLQNVPLSQVRRRQRQWIGHRDDDKPLFATGHQIELYHPGVWAKDVLMNHASERLGGAAYHFAVDTDAPKHLLLRWPGGSRPITDDPRLATADWAGLLDAPTPRYLAQVEGEFTDAAKTWGFRPVALDLFPALRRCMLESTNLTGVLTNSLHQLDWGLGLRHHAMPVSPIFHSPGYLLFAHHLLARADEFSGQYNAVLGEYRVEHSIATRGRPWPNLQCSPDGCEIPFWLDSLETGQRSRGHVFRDGGGVALRSLKGDSFTFNPSADGWSAADSLGRFLTANALRLSPRALTLTMFLRLLVADQFVHGIGGGRYDQVTDRVISRFLNIPAPAFSVTTATLLFPLANTHPRIDLTLLVQEGRRLRHGALDPQKMDLVGQISSLPRRSPERQRLFYDLHHRLSSLMHTPPYKDWEHRLSAAGQSAQDQQDIFNRELFFAIQPQERLEALIEKYRTAFDLH